MTTDGVVVVKVLVVLVVAVMVAGVVVAPHNLVWGKSNEVTPETPKGRPVYKRRVAVVSSKAARDRETDSLFVRSSKVVFFCRELNSSRRKTICKVKMWNVNGWVINR